MAKSVLERLKVGQLVACVEDGKHGHDMAKVVSNDGVTARLKLCGHVLWIDLTEFSDVTLEQSTITFH